MRNKKLTGFILLLIIMSLCSIAYAEAEGAGNAVADGFGKILKFPITMLHKMGDSLDKAHSTAPSEDVAVAPVYDLDAETTG